MIPFIPQSMARHKTRLAECLKTVYDTSKILTESDERPGRFPQNMFDFSDGIRLIISRETIRSEEVTHVSGSVDHAIWQYNNPEHCFNCMVKKILELFDLKKEDDISLVGFSEGGIPHWFVKSKTVTLN